MKDYAVVVCLHGDELFGLEVIDKISKEIPIFIGNPKAIEHKTRSIDSDLNRVFPGNPFGDEEEKRAFFLLEKLKDFKYIIDIHSSSGDTDLFGIITQFSKEKINLVQKLGLSKLVIMPSNLASGKALIDHVSCGISLEVGPHEKKEIVDEVMGALNNINEEHSSNREPLIIYQVIDIIYGEDNANPFMINFKEVKKGDLIAKGNTE